MLRNSLVAARGALTGAARGLSTAVAAAAAHRAFAVPRPAGAALTATLPAPATLAAEDELTLAPAAPIASKLREINARLVRRVTSELRAYHEARGALPPRRNGAGLDRDGAESAARRALRNCCALGQGHLAVEVYEAYRAAALRPLSPEVAAEVIGRLGDMWERPSAESPARWAAAHAERRAADGADGAFAPADGLELALLVESHLRADSGAARGAPPPPLVVGALVRTSALCGDVGRALELYRAAGGAVGHKPLASLLEALVASHRGGEAIALWRDGAARGLRVPRRTLLPLMRAAAEAAADGSDEQHELVTELYGTRLYGEVRARALSRRRAAPPPRRRARPPLPAAPFASTATPSPPPPPTPPAGRRPGARAHPTVRTRRLAPPRSRSLHQRRTPAARRRERERRRARESAVAAAEAARGGGAGEPPAAERRAARVRARRRRARCPPPLWRGLGTVARRGR